jgi:lipopolysaccharide transport system ATP-binding protein
MLAIQIYKIIFHHLRRIGRNHTKKSALFKSLAAMLEASGGAIDIGGRVTAILELRSSFHSNSSGRENILMVGCAWG